LLDELDEMPNVKFFFNHKLAGADFKNKKAWFEKRKSDAPQYSKAEEIEARFDFMIGADGAHSAVRYHLMKFTRMNYMQEYIDTLWCEFQIEPRKTSIGNDFRISPNHLHIWPAGGFMFIAIPSLDKSFTSTLFMPASGFRELDEHPDRVIPFFNEHFPGVVGDLIPESEIRRQYEENPHLPLISIKCTPYHFNSAAVILGDAAHAMVPFYGQGMNAGLEDVRVLYDKLDQYQPASHQNFGREERDKLRAKALAAYTEDRHPDATAINDLALQNYQEMRSDVRSPIYRLRKFVEERLYAYAPSLGWATQYSRVSFGNMRYSDVEQKAQRQSRILTTELIITLGGVAAWAGWAIWRWNRAGDALKVTTRALFNLGTRIEQMGRRWT
jgi:kynurenine 3-monooxygenase